MKSTSSAAFLAGDRLEKEHVAPGIKRQILGYDQRLMLVRVWFDQGAVGTVHRHEHSQTTFVESGEFEFTVGSQLQRVRAGDCVYIAPNTDHGAKCLRAGILIDVFSPAREDFLEEETL